MYVYVSVKEAKRTRLVVVTPIIDFPANNKGNHLGKIYFSGSPLSVSFLVERSQSRIETSKQILGL